MVPHWLKTVNAFTHSIKHALYTITLGANLSFHILVYSGAADTSLEIREQRHPLVYMTTGGNEKERKNGKHI